MAAMLNMQTVAQHYFIIDKMYSVYPGGGLLGDKVSPVWQSEQTRDNHPMLGQRRIRLTAIKTAMSCEADPTLNRYWVGTLCCMDVAQQTQNIVLTLYSVGPPLYKCYTNVLCLLGWPAPSMVVEGIGLHVEVLVSLVLQ